MRLTAVLLALLLAAGACDSDGGDTTEAGGTTILPADNAGDVASSDDADVADPSSVEVPDPCAVFQEADRAALEAVIGTISSFDGPDERTQDDYTDDEGQYQSRTCAAVGETFKAQVILQPAAIGFFLQNREEVDGVGDEAFTGTTTDDPEDDPNLVFTEGDVSGLVTLLFAGGDLASAPEPTVDDVVAVGTALATALA